jgi:uncharacterized protein (DUF2147 family)
MRIAARPRIVAGTLIIGSAASVLAAGTVLADPSGRWKRPNGDIVQVSSGGGRLNCRILEGGKPGFEMCNGMAGGGNSWKGAGMKHPDMPGFMTFNGTVSVSGNTLSIKGCAIGETMCDSEIWSRAK